MARVEATVHIEAPPPAVWSVLVAWEDQPRWMVDAVSVTVLSPTREGTGVVLRCITSIALGVRIKDDLSVTDWDPPTALGVRHLGPWFSGVGAFELTQTADGTHLRWWEEVEPPLGRIGEPVAALAMPYVARVFRRSLSQLKRVAEGRHSLVT